MILATEVGFEGLKSALAAAHALFGDRGELAHHCVLAVFDRGGEDEAGDRCAVGKQCFNQRFEIGKGGRGPPEEEVGSTSEVMTLANFFERLDVFEKAVVI